MRRLRLGIAALQAQISAIRLQHEDELRAICAELRSSVVPPAQQPESQPVPQSTSQQETRSDQQPVTQSDSLPTSPPILCPAPKKMKKKTKRKKNKRLSLKDEQDWLAKSFVSAVLCLIGFSKNISEKPLSLVKIPLIFCHPHISQMFYPFPLASNFPLVFTPE